MNLQEYLIYQARQYINEYEPVPLDLVMKMAAIGMDVVAIEKQLMKERDDLNG